MTNQKPWQLKMFKKTLKKQQRLWCLNRHLRNITDNEECLLVTCGDNNGAINYFLRELGGRWLFADLERRSIDEMSELLNADVLHVEQDSLPYQDERFDRVVSIDVHEHLEEPSTFTGELCRVAKKGGQVIVTVPNGDETKVVTRIKNAVGMTKEKYGHVREGYDIPELKELLIKSGITPVAESSFSKFFTEMLELSINFLYVNILSKKSKAKVEAGTIAPATEDQLKSVEKTYKLYSLVYPFFLLVSKFDALFFFSRGYAVTVEGRKNNA
ncbi:MAG: methyltransferase domain-containing protein [Deltaproteobacteria bacterium]|nr:methyltransferase domain-containing protein [Deltaproteobacteria bacterium]